jgi:hypothetical protein
VADAGSHADAEGLAVRVVALATTMGGMCVFALMIGPLFFCFFFCKFFV